MRIFRLALIVLALVMLAQIARAGGYGQVVTSNVLMAPAPAYCPPAVASTLQVYTRTVAAVPLTIVPTAPVVAAPTIVQPAPMVYAAPAVVQQQAVQTYAAPAVQLNVAHSYGVGAGFRQFNVNVNHGYGGFGRNVFVQRNVVRHNAGFFGRQVVKQKTVVRNGLFGRSVQKTVIRSR